MPEITGGNDWMVWKYGNEWLADSLFDRENHALPALRFQTWREAYDYAERMARPR